MLCPVLGWTGHIYVWAWGFDDLAAIPTVIGAREVQGGEVFTIDKDEAVAHIAPHDQRFTIDFRILGCQLKKQDIVSLNITTRIVLVKSRITQHLVARTFHS